MDKVDARLKNYDGLNLATAVLAVCAGVLLVRPAASVFSFFSRNYNEGWNAFHAAHAFGAGTLYPGPNALVINNYPPLSFYLVGAAGRMVGDVVTAGRLISLLSFLAIAANIFWITRQSGGSQRSAWFGAVIVSATLLTFNPAYVAVNDPQLLGNAIMLTGFGLFLNRRSSFGGLVASCATMVAAGLIKHNQIALPLALSAWLAMTDRKLFAKWIACCFVLVVLFVGVLLEVHGVRLVYALLEPRPFSLEDGVRALSSWLGPLLPLIGASMFFTVTGWRSTERKLIALWVWLSLCEGFVFVAFRGGNNMLFEAILASSVAAGLIVEPVIDGIRRQGVSARGSAFLAVCLLSMGVMLFSPLRLAGAAEYAINFGREEAALREQLKFISSRSGPAVCEELTLCFWAGKDFELDPFNSRMRFDLSPLRENVLLDQLRQHHFEVIQTNAWNGDDFNFSDHFMAELRCNYAIATTLNRPPSALWVPKSDAHCD